MGRQDSGAPPAAAPPTTRSPADPTGASSSPACCPVCGCGDSSEYLSGFAVRLRTCEACGARYVHPIPPHPVLRERYEGEHRSGKWDDLLGAGPPQEPRRRAELLRRLHGGWAAGRPPPGPLLDVGFGDGRFLDQAAQVGWSCAGIEIALAAARGVADRHPVAVCTFDAMIDAPVLGAVTFWDVLEHLAQPGSAIQDAARRLRAGGLLAASMPSLASVTSRVEGPGWRYYDLEKYGHLVHMSPHHLRRMFQAEGLRVVHLETHGSVDLRHSLWRGWASRRAIAGPVLDRLSGLVSRWAVGRGHGNTILIVGQKEGREPGQGSGVRVHVPGGDPVERT